MKTTTHTLKEFAYLHFRRHGFTPAQAVQNIRIAISVSAKTDKLFEECVDIACALVAIPGAFRAAT